MHMQNVLQAIADGHATAGHVAEKIGLLRKQVTQSVQVLRNRGFVTISGRGANATYSVTEAGRKWIESGQVLNRFNKKKAYGLRERAWWLIRELRKFTMHDLLMTLATGDERDAKGNLRRYVEALARVQIVMRMKRRVACPGVSQGLVLWRLNNDVGPKAPVLRINDGTVFDPNHDAVLTPVADTEVADE